MYFCVMTFGDKRAATGPKFTLSVTAKIEDVTPAYTTSTDMLEIPFVAGENVTGYAV